MKYSLYLLIALASIVVLSSCELTDVIDNDPPNNLVDDNVVTDAESSEELLNGAYSVLHDQFYYMYTETTPGLLSGSIARNGFLADAGIAANSVPVDELDVANYWQAFYKLIDASNTVIELVGEIPESEFSGTRKQEIIAEARFLRAMGHFDALRYFGQYYDLTSSLGVIIRTESVDFTTRDKGRSSVQEVYDQINSDLDFAIQNAPDLTDPYYSSKTAAKALKARVLLFMGEYGQAGSLADEVITDNTRSLASTYEEVFSAGFNSDEMIFMRHTNEVTFASDRKHFTYGFQHAVAGEWLREKLEGDPRQPVTYNPDPESEFAILKVNKESLFSPTYFMRLAQVYLIKAEGLARSGAPLEQAEEPLETVRSRALGTEYESTASTREELLDEIFDEIVRELAFENGSDWFAAIRFEKIMDLKPEVTSTNQFILPIPLTEIQANTELEEQNPGYNN